MKKTRFKVLKTLGFATLCVALSACVLVGCGGSGNTANTKSESTAADELVELQIFAANSLEKAMPKVQALYTAQHPNVTFADSQFKASGDLVEEIQAGAKTDILVTASKSTMDDAADYIIPESRINMFGNDLVVCASEKSDIKIKSLEDFTSSKIKKIAIGDANFVPAGKYANQSLYAVSSGDHLYSADAGIGGTYSKKIADKVMQADKVGTCAAWVKSGDCEVGMIYSSDLYRYDGIKNVYTVPSEMHNAIVYPGATLTDSPNQDVANDFLEFCMTDADALAVWQDYGFELL